LNYSAGIVSTSFWYLETKITAEYLIEGSTKKDLYELSLNDNIYQVNSEGRAKRVASKLYDRLEKFPEEMLRYFINADSHSGRLFVLISILRGDKLFFEFVYEVFREHIILGDYTLKKTDFNRFFNDKKNQSETVDSWTEETISRMISAYRLFLSEAGLLDTSGDVDKIIVPFVDFGLKVLFEKNSNLTPYIKAITGES